MINNTFDEIAQKLDAAKKIAVFCHVRPDGDALGSGLALCLALKQRGKTAVMCCEDKVPAKFAFLPVLSQVLTQLPKNDYDTYVCVDCADGTRAGSFSAKFNAFGGVTINFDHHVSNDGYAKLNYVVVCPATCQIMTEFLTYAGYEITKDIADLLMLGLITDSGTFTHCDVEPATFLAAALLKEKGADVNYIDYNLNGRQSKQRAILFGKVMSNIRFALNEKLAIITVTNEMLATVGGDMSVTEGFVDFPMTIDGVEVAASLLENKKGHYKISLRSKGKVNVNTVAGTFGGGGHVLASGCMLFGEYEEVVERLTQAVEKNL